MLHRGTDVKKQKILLGHFIRKISSHYLIIVWRETLAGGTLVNLVNDYKFSKV